MIDPSQPRAGRPVNSTASVNSSRYSKLLDVPLPSQLRTRRRILMCPELCADAPPFPESRGKTSPVLLPTTRILRWPGETLDPDLASDTTSTRSREAWRL